MSNSRELILAAVKKNKPEPSALPEMEVFENNFQDLAEGFTEVLVKIGGAVIRTENEETLKTLLHKVAQDYLNPLCVNSQWLQTARTASPEMDPHELENIDLAIIEGSLGVAENGCIWVTEAAMGNRALPFVTQHLIIVVPRASLVYNMHEAYKIIEVPKAGYGVFIAGPSKTADIEQSLVIGAHGPKSLLVIMVE